MNDLEEIIRSSALTINKGRYIYAKVKTAPPIEKHFMISKDADEITVVTREENLGELELLEKNKDYYILIELKVSLPFYAVGFLATISSAISKEGMNNLIVSTYSKDYFMIREEHIEKAKKVLISLGFKNSGS